MPTRRLAALLLLVACSHLPTTGPDAALRQARAADVAWSSTLPARDRAGFLSFVAEDALFAGPRGLQAGRESVWAGWQGRFAPGAAPFSWAPSGGGASAAGDLAWTLGRWRAEPKGEGGAPLVLEGQYLTVWRRGTDGRYRAVLDGGYQPATALEPLERTPRRTLLSADGTLEAALGTWTRAAADGPRQGAFLTVRRRAGQGWQVLLDGAVPFAEGD